MSGPESESMADQRLLNVQGLTKYFDITKGFLKRVAGQVRAVDDVNLYLNAGETLAIVGESGSGKTTLGRMIVRAIEPTRGQVLLQMNGAGWTDLIKLRGEELRMARRHFHMIFQDPYSSLDPRMTVLDIVKEPLLYNKIAKGDEAKAKVVETLKLVGLDDKQMGHYPHAFSGGQRQRIGIARSLVCRPKLIVCDESVSALDVSVQAQILRLLEGLRERRGLSFLFVSHDLGVVRHSCDRLCVMYLGRIVEEGPTKQVLDQPMHPYTRLLRDSSPVPDPRARAVLTRLTGEMPSPAALPSGCPFHPRCDRRSALCSTVLPDLTERNSDHAVACHHPDIQTAGPLQTSAVYSQAERALRSGETWA